MHEMLKEKQDGKHSGYLPWPQVDGQRRLQNQQKWVNRHVGGHDLQCIVDVNGRLFGMV